MIVFSTRIERLEKLFGTLHNPLVLSSRFLTREPFTLVNEIFTRNLVARNNRRNWAEKTIFLSDVQRARIVTLEEVGCSERETSVKIGCSKQKINNFNLLVGKKSFHSMQLQIYTHQFCFNL